MVKKRLMCEQVLWELLQDQKGHTDHFQLKYVNRMLEPKKLVCFVCVKTDG